MELVTATQMTAVVTDVVGYITSNWGAVAVAIGFGVGYKIFRGLFNHGLRGRV